MEMMDLIGAGNNPQATYDCCCCSCVSKSASKQSLDLQGSANFVEKTKDTSFWFFLMMCPLFLFHIN